MGDKILAKIVKELLYNHNIKIKRGIGINEQRNNNKEKTD